MEFHSEYLRISFVICIGRIALWSIVFYNSFSIPLRKYVTIKSLLYFFCVLLGIIGTILLPLDIHIQWEKHIQETNTPIQIFLDVSLSMTAQDISPSRFQIAKQWITSITERISWNSISLIAFSGLPLVQIPYTYDHNAFVQKLSSTRMSSFPPDTAFLGTALWDALLLGIKNMEQQWYKTGTRVIISDWDNNKWYDPQLLLSWIIDLPLKIHSIAIGWDNVLLGYDENNIPVMTNFDTTFLQTISTQTSGSFVHILESRYAEDGFLSISEHIDRDITTSSEIVTIGLGRYILLYLLFFAFLHGVYVSIYFKDFFVLRIWEK